MPKPQPSKFFLLFLVAVAVFGLALVPVLLFQPNLQGYMTPLRRPIVASSYTVICVLGIVAVFYPGKCRLMFQKPNAANDLSKPASNEMSLRGHHPDCEKFSANRITIGNSVFCASCSGLLIGAIAALVGIAAFSWGLLDFAVENLWGLALGEALMLVGLAQIKMGGYLKMAVNALFVVGSFVCLVMADLFGQSLPVDLFVLGLIVFLLWLRILLSEWNNDRICLKCGHCD